MKLPFDIPARFNEGERVQAKFHARLNGEHGTVIESRNQDGEHQYRIAWDGGAESWSPESALYKQGRAPVIDVSALSALRKVDDYAARNGIDRGEAIDRLVTAAIIHGLDNGEPNDPLTKFKAEVAATYEKKKADDPDEAKWFRRAIPMFFPWRLDTDGNVLDT